MNKESKITWNIEQSRSMMTGNGQLTAGKENITSIHGSSKTVVRMIIS
jgi:hypothetical protein